MRARWMAPCAVFLVLPCCDYELKKHRTGANSALAAGGLDSERTIDWSLISSAVLNQCADCHAGARSPSLNTLDAVRANVSRIWGEVSAAAMPPQNQGYAPLSDCKKSALRKWMDLGAPANSDLKVRSLPECGPSPPPPVSPQPIPLKDQPLSYQVLLAQILQPRCLRCHNIDDPSDASMVLFYPQSEIMKDDRRWSPPGRNSGIVAMLTRADEKRMPPPKEGGPLDQDAIEYIVRYVDAGKPP